LHCGCGVLLSRTLSRLRDNLYNLRFIFPKKGEGYISQPCEILARDLIRNDTNLQNSVLNEVTDLPIINLESVSEVSAMAYDAQNRAHSIYWEDENN